MSEGGGIEIPPTRIFGRGLHYSAATDTDHAEHGWGGEGRKTAGASGIIQMDTSDGEGNFLIERFRSRHCHAEQQRQSGEGGTWGGREGEGGID